jgi:hypothetical protein
MTTIVVYLKYLVKVFFLPVKLSSIQYKKDQVYMKLFIGSSKYAQEHKLYKIVDL